MEKNFADYGIGILRAFVRYALPDQRGAGKLGNIGHKDEIIDALISAGLTVNDLENWQNNASNTENTTTNNNKGGNMEKHENNTTENTTDNATINGAFDAFKASILAAFQAAQKSAEAEKPAIDPAEIERIAAAAAEKIYSAKNPVLHIEVKVADKTAKIDGAHMTTPAVMRALNVGDNVLLVGPAGSGKTTVCKKIAEALGEPFYPVSICAQTTKSDLLGYKDVRGDYQTTPIREAYENGGLLLLDEMDKGNPGVLGVLNSLLDNGFCSFPDKVVKRHEKFYCVAAANTFGRGADRLYVGSCAMDEATRNRFQVLNFDYDEALERRIVEGIYNNVKALQWLDNVQTLRAAADALKVRIIISPRASISGAKMLKAYPETTFAELENALIFKGLEQSQIDKIKAQAASNKASIPAAGC